MAPTFNNNVAIVTCDILTCRYMCAMTRNDSATSSLKVEESIYREIIYIFNIYFNLNKTTTHFGVLELKRLVRVYKSIESWKVILGVFRGFSLPMYFKLRSKCFVQIEYSFLSFRVCACARARNLWFRNLVEESLLLISANSFRIIFKLWIISAVRARMVFCVLNSGKLMKYFFFLFFFWKWSLEFCMPIFWCTCVSCICVRVCMCISQRGFVLTSDRMNIWMTGSIVTFLEYNRDCRG